MAPKLRSQTRVNTSWSYLPIEIRQMIIAEVALAVCHDAIRAPNIGVHLPVRDTAKPLNFIAHFNYELGQKECVQVLERLGTDLSLQEYFLDQKIYEPDNIVADKDENSEDDSDADSDVDDEDDEDSEDDDMIDADASDANNDSEANNEARSDKAERGTDEESKDTTAFDDDDAKKPLTPTAAQARRARWYERHNYVRQPRMMIMHAADAIDMQWISKMTL